MIKGIIFDMDGVLTFTDKYHYICWKKIADQENIYFDEEINNRLRGVSRMDSLNIILEKANKEYSLEEKTKLAELKNSYYVECLNELKPTDISDEVRNTLINLRELGIKLAIASSSKNAKLIAEKLNITSLFDFIVDGNMISKSKPDPEVFIKAADMINLNPSDCFVVEDAKSGITAAYNGGFKTVGFGKDVKDFDLAKYHIDSLTELLNLIEDNENIDTNAKPVISLSHIKKVYPGNVCAVKDFSLDIYDGEFVVFVGPSGCGKSTVLRMIAGLEEITDGELYIDSKNMTDAEPKERNIAMVFQNYALYPHLSVRKNIGFPLYMEDIPFSKWFNFKYRKERKAEIDALVEEVASKIELSPYLDRKPKNLSGGQRQRVALGRAIIRNPKAFLLDEPLSNLDAKMRAGMRTEISKLHEQLKAIFIYVTHDQIEAMTMGSKIVVLKDGIIQQIGTPKEVFMNPKNKFVAGFIGTPQMNFFDCTLNKDSITLKNGTELKLPKSLFDRIDDKYISKEVCLGVRPKAISIDNMSNINGKVTISEQLGDEALVYFNIDGYDNEYSLSMITYNNYKSGESVGLSFNLDNASLFDIETEESILL